MNEEVTELVRRLGCPAATCPGRDVQIAELRQRHQLVNRPQWRDGYAEVESSPRVPMLLLRYAHGVNVATFNEGTGRPRLNVWGRFFPAVFPFGQDGKTRDLNEDAQLHIAEDRHPARFALIDITDYTHRPCDHLAVYGVHILELARTVVAFGSPDQLDGIHLEWRPPD